VFSRLDERLDSGLATGPRESKIPSGLEPSGLELCPCVPNGGVLAIVDGGENGDSGVYACDSGDELEGDNRRGTWP
jgi:hypothetical protein